MPDSLIADRARRGVRDFIASIKSDMLHEQNGDVLATLNAAVNNLDDASLLVHRAAVLIHIINKDK